MPEALPAVTVPPSLRKIGRNFARSCVVVFDLTCSSTENSTTLSPGLVHQRDNLAGEPTLGDGLRRAAMAFECERVLLVTGNGVSVRPLFSGGDTHCGICSKGSVRVPLSASTKVASPSL